jgi:hypothetical protein
MGETSTNAEGRPGTSWDVFKTSQDAVETSRPKRHCVPVPITTRASHAAKRFPISAGASRRRRMAAANRCVRSGLNHCGLSRVRGRVRAARREGRLGTSCRRHVSAYSVCLLAVVDVTWWSWLPRVALGTPLMTRTQRSGRSAPRPPKPRARPDGVSSSARRSGQPSASRSTCANRRCLTVGGRTRYTRRTQPNWVQKQRKPDRVPARLLEIDTHERTSAWLSGSRTSRSLARAGASRPSRK